MNTTTTLPTWVTISRIPRPVLIFAGLILLLAGIKAVTGGLGASRPANVALAVGDGLMSVFHDDKSLENMILIFTKDGKNNDGTVELRDFGAGLGRLLFGGGVARAGGNLYFRNYRHRSGVVLNGGPLAIELSNADSNGEKAGRFRVQGSVAVSGSDQPVVVQLDFISPKETYDVRQLTGSVILNGTTTPLQP